MSLGYLMKKKRDAEQRLRQSDPNKSTVYHTEGGVVVSSSTDSTAETSTPIPEQNQTVEQHIAQQDPHPQYLLDTQFKPQTHEFIGVSTYTVNHNLNRDPIVSIWLDNGKHGFGAQAFGTTPFGGSPPTNTRIDNTAIIERVNGNSFKITFTENKYGRVVCF